MADLNRYVIVRNDEQKKFALDKLRKAGFQWVSSSLAPRGYRMMFVKVPKRKLVPFAGK